MSCFCCGSTEVAGFNSFSSMPELNRAPTPSLSSHPGEKKIKSLTHNLGSKLSTGFTTHDFVDKFFKLGVSVCGVVGETLKLRGGDQEAIDATGKVKKRIVEVRDFVGLWNVFRGCLCNIRDSALRISVAVKAIFQGSFDETQNEAVLEGFLTSQDRESIKESGADKHQFVITKYADATTGKISLGTKILWFMREIFKIIEQSAFTVCFTVCAPILFVDSVITKLSDVTKSIGTQFSTFWAIYHLSGFLSNVCDLISNGARESFEWIAMTSTKIFENTFALLGDSIKLNLFPAITEGVHPIWTASFSLCEALPGFIRVWYSTKS